jgi:tetratricopeptide (TPR) repeat protein
MKVIPNLFAPHISVILNRVARHVLQYAFLSLTVATLLALFSPTQIIAQSGYTLWGDVKLDDSKADTPIPSSLTVVLYDESTKIVGRQTVSNRGRYRFNNLRAGEYDIAIESETDEITRVRLDLHGPSGSDIRQDFEFAWKPRIAGHKPVAGVISAAEVYNRSSANKSLFQKAQEAVEKKENDEALRFLRQILDKDNLDFQVWTLLGTIYVIEEKPVEAEKAYLKAIEVKPTYAMALINLGRLRTTQKRFEEAIDPLTRAAELQPQSPDANLYLGETYLKLKKGSKAIPYLNDAARLGRLEAYLDLGWLYNAAGMKDKAAAEYEALLKQNPAYPERKKLEQYIDLNKKPK